MHHDIALISTMAISLVYALVGGYYGASRLRSPPLVGYLIAGRGPTLRPVLWRIETLAPIGGDQASFF